MFLFIVFDIILPFVYLIRKSNCLFALFAIVDKMIYSLFNKKSFSLEDRPKEERESMKLPSIDDTRLVHSLDNKHVYSS